MDFDLEATRRDLTAMRVKHGADTPIGHRCSNLIEQMQNIQNEHDPDARRYLRASIAKSVAELASLSGGSQ